MDECIAGAITPQCGNTFDANNAMTAFGSQPLGYDLNGNLTNDGSNTYQWNARNHLSSMAGATNASFVYDGVGRRAGKTINGTTTQFFYDLLNPVQELDENANVTANQLTGLNLDEYFSRTATSGQVSFLTDMLGSTLGLTDWAGGIDTHYSYEPFGYTIAVGANTNSYEYTGREHDSTGLYYHRARYFSPTIQRFISQDPLGFTAGDSNLYAYASNSPTVFSDPLGLTAVSNAEFLWDWVRGAGDTDRTYGEDDFQTREMMNSPGVAEMRAQFLRNHCQSQIGLSYGTLRAYRQTILDPRYWRNTALQVGGFANAEVINNTATFTVPNDAGTHSFFYLLVPDRKSPTGLMRTIHQKFQWTEPIPRSCSCH